MRMYDTFRANRYEKYEPGDAVVSGGEGYDKVSEVTLTLRCHGKRLRVTMSPDEAHRLGGALEMMARVQEHFDTTPAEVVMANAEKIRQGK